MAVSHKQLIWLLALVLGFGLIAAQAAADPPPEIQEIPSCAPNFCGYVVDGDGVDSVTGDSSDVRTCPSATCGADWVPAITITADDEPAGTDTLTVSAASINHDTPPPGNANSLVLDGPSTSAVISGASTALSPGCFGFGISQVSCTRILYDQRWWIQHDAPAQFNFGGLVVRAVIDDNNDQITQYHVQIAAQHEN